MSQAEIDKLDYPPTHQYNLERLEPLGALKKRMRLIPYQIFNGKRFLDIGCNKGFFSLVAKQGCEIVEAIDNNRDYVNLCKKLGINVQLSTFREFNPDKKYDRIMMGNVMHYMYRECGDWSFIIKLAAISSGLVLIEAPTGMNCKLMKDAIPKHLRKNFNNDMFMESMNRFFTLKSISNSPSQGRYIMLFERIQEPTVAFAIHDGISIIKQDKESTVYKSKDNIIKIQNNHTEKDEIRIFIASHSPISNGIKSLVYNYGNYQGWTEEISDQIKLKPYTNQEQVFQKLCIHNVYLAKLGYTEVDMSVSNFWPDMVFYDKGGIRHVTDVDPLSYNDINTGWFFTMFRNQFNIPIDFESIQLSLKTRSSFKIQKMYEGFITFKSTKISLGKLFRI